MNEVPRDSMGVSSPPAGVSAPRWQEHMLPRPTVQVGKPRPGRLGSRQTQHPGHTSKACLTTQQLHKGCCPVSEPLVPRLLCATCHGGQRPPSGPHPRARRQGKSLVPGPVWPPAKDPPLQASAPHASADRASRLFRPRYHVSRRGFWKQKTRPTLLGLSRGDPSLPVGSSPPSHAGPCLAGPQPASCCPRGLGAGAAAAGAGEGAASAAPRTPPQPQPGRSVTDTLS